MSRNDRPSLFRRLLLAAAVGAGFAGPATAEEGLTLLRIGTGPTGGAYFPVGGLIATAISNPPGSPPCASGGSCGVPGLVASAVASGGTLDNLRAVAEGRMDTALAQADLAARAHAGETPFGPRKGAAPSNLRALAALYPEAVHLVARADAGIRAVADLRGKRVSLGPAGSATRFDAELVLAAFRLPLKALKPAALALEEATEKLKAGALDAFFFVGGLPVPAVADLAREMPVVLVPLTGKGATALRGKNPAFAPAVVPAGTYKGQEADVPTMTVKALWVAAAEADPGLVHGITAALWHPGNRKVLDSGHPAGRQIRLETALEGLTLPLHPGARRFYDKTGPAAKEGN